MNPKSIQFIPFILLFMFAGGCSKSAPPPAQEPTPVLADRGERGELCSEENPCAEPFECAQTHGAFCEDVAACASDEKCDLEIKACTAMRCVDECTSVAKRYRFSDRKLLSLPSAKPALRDWRWGSKCSVEGLCDLQNEACVATTRTCAESLVCAWFGQCTAKDGKCVVSNESCKSARVCTQNGRCTPVDAVCTATRDEDCAASDYCEKLRWCAVQEKYGICRRAPGDESSGSVNLHGTQKLKKDGDLAIEPVEGGHSIADVFAKRDAIKDTRIQVRGKVVKYTAGILKRNFIHLQDGSGSETDKTHDLTVTTQDPTEIGKIITVEGTVIADRDFGSGYFYSVILEESKVIATD
jgi:hypothetical protein